MTTDVSAVIDDSRIYAAQTLAAGAAALNEAIGDLRGLVGLTTGQKILPTINLDPPVPGDPGDPPVYAGDKWNAPTPPPDQVPQLLEIDVPNFGEAPHPVPSVLPFNQPPTPTGNYPNGALLDGVPSVPTEIDVPPPPPLMAEIAGIPPPVLIPVELPDAPVYVPPNFEGVRPIFDVPPPADLEDTYRNGYAVMAPAMVEAVNSQFDAFMAEWFPQFKPGLQAIEDRLAIYLKGGTALTPALENAIYGRTQDKVYAEVRRTATKNWGEAARAGHTIPPQILLNIQAEADMAGRDNLARTAAEIAIDQGKREQENLQFAVRQSTELRKIAIDAGLGYYGHLVQLNGQALEYVRSLVDTIVKAYDLQVRYAEIQVRIYEADARVYEARLRGAMAVIEVYKAMLEAESLKVTVNRQQIELYTARIGAVQAEANVYKTLVESLGLEIQLKKLEVDVYDARVRAYGAQVNAWTARWQGYEAAVRGEAAKVQASAETVRAFSAQVQAYGETVRAKATQVDAQARVNESKIRVFHEQVETFRALVMGQAEAIRAEVTSFEASIHGFMAKATAISEHARAEIASYEAGMHAIIASAQIFMEQLRESDHMRIARAEGMTRIGTSIADIYGRVASSAVSGMNSLVSSSETKQAAS